MIWPTILHVLPSDLEAGYRAEYLADDYRQACLGLSLVCLPLLFLAHHDLHYLGYTPLAYLLLSARAALIAWAFLLAWRLRRVRSPLVFDAWLLAWGLGGVLLGQLIRLSRPPDYLANFALEVVVIIVLFTLLPIRPQWRPWPGILYALSALGALWFVKTNPGEGPLGSYTVALVLAAMGGGGFALRLENMRRRQFLSQYWERLARRELERLATTDGLTGILNRRRFLELAEVEFLRHQRYHRPLAFITADLDHFKRVNDQFGHQAGDAVLKSFAEHMAGCVRGQDLLGRLGGEEFGLVLPETSSEQARLVAERIRAGCDSLGLELAPGQSVSFTVSLGVSEARPGDQSLAQLMSRSDAALYQAKESGRNQVVLAA